MKIRDGIMLKKAIVRTPGSSLICGTSDPNFGSVDYPNALTQLKAYINALETCGLSVTILVVLEDYPDSVFVEDTAVVTGDLAVISNPGVASRKGESPLMAGHLSIVFKYVEHIKDPGTLDGGDVMQMENHFYIGVSKRTNHEGADQFKAIVTSCGYTASKIEHPIHHLKTGVIYLGENTLLSTGDLINHPEFGAFKKIEVGVDEAPAANIIRLNDYVLMASGFPKTWNAIEKNGLNVIETDISEYRKLLGGLTCMSLRFS